MTALMRARGLSKQYTLRRGALGGRAGTVQALREVDLDIEEGECLSIVGESGSGKTTLGRCLIRLVEPTSGAVFYRDENLLELPSREVRRRRRFFQMIFQDPYGSLNPRMKIGETLAEPLRVHQVVPRDGVGEEVGRLLDLVGLPRGAAERYPHEFSGGQRQRVGIARALAPRPEIVIADEPVSALDVSVQAQILNLILDLRRELGLSILFIAHDLAVVEAISDRVGVLHRGELVELGPSGQVFGAPKAEYTRRLLAAVPVPEPGRRRRST